MKKYIKFSIILLISIVILFSNTVYAEDSGGGTSVTDIGAWKDQEGIASVDDAVNSWVVEAIEVMKIISVTVALTILLVIAIKYMTSSAGDRAEIKKYAFAYVTGAVVLFGASGILSMLQNVAEMIS